MVAGVDDHPRVERLDRPHVPHRGGHAFGGQLVGRQFRRVEHLAHGEQAHVLSVAHLAAGETVADLVVAHATGMGLRPADRHRPLDDVERVTQHLSQLLVRRRRQDGHPRHL